MLPSKKSMVEELKKGLGFWAVYSLIVTSMIGTSLFYGIAAAAGIAGSASILSWLILGFIAMYVAACFGELIALFPQSGGVYEFAKQAFGRFPSFLIGWIAWIVANVGSAVLVVAAMDFVLPGSGFVYIGTTAISKATIKFISSVAIIIIFNYVTYRGIQASESILLIFALIMLTLIVSLLIPGFRGFDINNFSDFKIHPLLILAAIFFITESFFGWESASFLAEETKNAEKTIPKALMTATATVVVLGISLAAMTLGRIPAAQLATDPNPILTIASTVLPFAVPLVILGVFLTFMGGVISGVISSPRLLFALARDKLFIQQCTKIDEKHQTPVNAIIFQTIITIIVVVIAFGNYTFLLSMLVPLALFMYAVVLFSVPVIRLKYPDRVRSFKVWGGSWLPIVVALLYAGVVASWILTTASALSVLTLIAGFIILAFPIYLFLTMVYNPDAIIIATNAAASLNYILEDILLPKKVRSAAVDLFRGHLRGKEVLEFGAGVGTFTLRLAEEVGPEGKVLAVDLSKTNLNILAERMRKKGHYHVSTLHDEHQVNRVHPDIKRADVIYSIGFLGYVQDLRKVLHEMHDILSHHGRICFIEYTNFFGVLPDPEIVSNTRSLEATFREAGFAVSIEKRKGLLWNYIIVHGIKTDSKVPYI